MKKINEINLVEIKKFVNKGYTLSEISKSLKINKSQLSLFIKFNCGGWNRLRSDCIFPKSN